MHDSGRFRYSSISTVWFSMQQSMKITIHKLYLHSESNGDCRKYHFVGIRSFVSLLNWHWVQQSKPEPPSKPPCPTGNKPPRMPGKPFLTKSSLILPGPFLQMRISLLPFSMSLLFLLTSIWVPWVCRSLRLLMLGYCWVRWLMESGAAWMSQWVQSVIAVFGRPNRLILISNVDGILSSSSHRSQACMFKPSARVWPLKNKSWKSSPLLPTPDKLPHASLLRSSSSKHHSSVVRTIMFQFQLTPNSPSLITRTEQKS